MADKPEVTGEAPVEETTPEPTAEELRAAAIARGDIVEDAAEEEVVEEEEEAPEEETSEEAEEEDLPAAAKKKADPKIPKSRFDTKAKLLQAEKRKNRELQAKLEELQAAQEKASTSASERKVEDALSLIDLESSLDELDASLIKARQDGDADEEARISKQIRQTERAVNKLMLSEAATTATQRASAKMEYDTTVAAIEEQYPQLNPDNEDTYDEDVAAEVIELANAFEKTGHSPAEAVIRAVTYVLPNTSNLSSLENKRAKKKTDVKKNVAASKQTPPDLDAAGLDSDRGGASDDAFDPANVLKMSETEFDALPEDTKKRMRGDFG